MTPQTTDHPAWAITQAKAVLACIDICDTADEKIEFLILHLRAAYHQGGRDTCDELRKK